MHIFILYMMAVGLELSAAVGQEAAYIYRVPAVRAPEVVAAATAATAPTSLSALQQQYYTQDIYGQYAYGYSEPLSSKHEMRTSDGVTRGAYSYVDATGRVQTVRYIADADGFRVAAATNLPTPPTPVTETPEVAAARAEHLAAHQALRSDVPRAHAPPPAIADTPEVAAAKAEFFKRYEEELLRHKLLREHHATLQASHTAAPPNDFSFNVITPERSYLPVIASINANRP